MSCDVRAAGILMTWWNRMWRCGNSYSVVGLGSGVWCSRYATADFCLSSL